MNFRILNIITPDLRAAINDYLREQEERSEEENNLLLSDDELLELYTYQDEMRREGFSCN